MYEIDHLLHRHRKEMQEIEDEQQRNKKLREKKLLELERLAEEAMRLNQASSQEDLKKYAI